MPRIEDAPAAGVTQANPARDAKSKASKTQPSRSLPTDRIKIDKQFLIFRAYAACHETSGKPVTNSEVGGVVGLTSSTVSLANAFSVSVGFLDRPTDGGYVPSGPVMSFARAFKWTPDAAAHKLAPLVRQAWFAQS